MIVQDPIDPQAHVAELDALVRSVRPTFSVRWNPSVYCWPYIGMYEVFGESGFVLYRRRTPDEVRRLAQR